MEERDERGEREVEGGKALLDKYLPNMSFTILQNTWACLVLLMRHNQTVIWKHSEPNTTGHRGHLDVEPGPTAQLWGKRLAEKGSKHAMCWCLCEKRKQACSWCHVPCSTCLAQNTTACITNTYTPFLQLSQQLISHALLWGKCYSRTGIRRYFKVPLSCFN